MIPETQNTQPAANVSNNNVTNTAAPVTNTPVPVANTTDQASEVILDINALTKKVKILVAEDETDARTIFLDLIGGEGYDVDGADDGFKVLEMAALKKYDLILLDIMMPNKDGLATLQELKANPEKYGNPIVVMLTNISGDAAVEKALDLGAVGYKLKIGTEPLDLLQDIKKYLAGQKDVQISGLVEGSSTF